MISRGRKPREVHVRMKGNEGQLGLQWRKSPRSARWAVRNRRKTGEEREAEMRGQAHSFKLALCFLSALSASGSLP